MAQVIIRKLDPDIVERLRKRARAHGHSLEQELRLILGEAASSDHGEFRAWLEKHQIRARNGFDVVQAVRQDRERH